MTTQNQTRTKGGPSQERRPRWPLGTTTVTGTTLPKAPTARATVGSGSPSDSGGPRIEYVPRDDATPEGELALAAVYAVILQGHERNKAATPMTKRLKEVNPEERRQQGQEQ